MSSIGWDSTRSTPVCLALLPNLPHGSRARHARRRHSARPAPAAPLPASRRRRGYGVDQRAEQLAFGWQAKSLVEEFFVDLLELEGLTS